jgi:hypothetical protein
MILQNHEIQGTNMLHLCEYDATLQSSDKVCAKEIVEGMTVVVEKRWSSLERERVARRNPSSAGP